MKHAPDSHLVAALQFAKSNAPCVIVVDTISALEIVRDHLSRTGKVFSMAGGFCSAERLDHLRKFDACEYQNSYLVVTKQLTAFGGWQTRRSSANLAATGSLSDLYARQIRGRVPESSIAYLKGLDGLDWVDKSGQNSDDKAPDCVQPQVIGDSPTRQKVALLSDSSNEWYFECDGHYIDIQQSEDGAYSVFFFNREDRSIATLEQRP